MPKTTEELEREILILNIKIEVLIDYLNVGGPFGPPYGRDSYDKRVADYLRKEGLAK
jgi:hypothetical protein